MTAVPDMSGTRVTIDGTTIAADEGVSLLHALAQVGIDVPSLCDDHRLAPFGECRMCLVRIDGNPQPAAACVTPVRSGMAVETAPADIEAARHEILCMIAEHYPADAIAKAPDAPLHRLFARYGVTPATEQTEPGQVDDSHPCIAIDMNRCIDCFRCVRICASHPR
ncbi:MAG: 2Fe-2S iron-sulfur cluster-binding protein [Actinomycetota bacterium]